MRSPENLPETDFPAFLVEPLLYKATAHDVDLLSVQLVGDCVAEGGGFIDREIEKCYHSEVLLTRWSVSLAATQVYNGGANSQHDISNS